MKILVCDDSTFMRNILIDILKHSQWAHSQIFQAANGEEGVDVYTKEKPDLVLLDIVMPKKDGIAVLRDIGKIATVVVVSAIGQDRMVTEAKNLGARDFIQKPFNAASVVEVLGRVLSVAQGMQQPGAAAA